MCDLSDKYQQIGLAKTMTTSRAFDLFALIAGNSDLEPLFEGLVSQIHMDLILSF